VHGGKSLYRYEPLDFEFNLRLLVNGLTRHRCLKSIKEEQLLTLNPSFDASNVCEFGEDSDCTMKTDDDKLLQLVNIVFSSEILASENGGVQKTCASLDNEQDQLLCLEQCRTLYFNVIQPTPLCCSNNEVEVLTAQRYVIFLKPVLRIFILCILIRLSTIVESFALYTQG